MGRPAHAGFVPLGLFQDSLNPGEGTDRTQGEFSPKVRETADGRFDLVQGNGVCSDVPGKGSGYPAHFPSEVLTLELKVDTYVPELSHLIRGQGERFLLISDPGEK